MLVGSESAPTPRGAKGGLAGPVWTGFAIVLVVTLLDALRVSIKLIVSRPYAEWMVYLLQSCADDLLIGCVILLAVVWASNRVSRGGTRQYAVVFATVAIAVAVTGLAFVAWNAVVSDAGQTPSSFTEFALEFVPDWIRYSMLGMLIAGAWLYTRADAEQSAVLEEVALESARMDQQTAEARLQMLEAQIEPHFPFNTLAHVRRLYGTDRIKGARMLHNLKAYLAVALPQMREAESTLGREIAHVTAYLNIQQIRMGRRLEFAIDVPQALHDARMPPLMLLTLTENAIKHGLGPAPDGGRIDARATTECGRLRVEIADTGQGFTKSSGGGTGLANIRARLEVLYGNRASLTLGLNTPRGVVAAVVLPHEGLAQVRGDA